MSILNRKGAKNMPMKVKIFHKTRPEELEEPINEWLKDNPDIHIEHVTQSQVQHGQAMSMPVTVCTWYTESKYK